MAEEKLSRESHLKPKQVKLAVNALFKHVKQNKEKRPSLLGEEEVLWMIMALKKTPVPDRKPKRIPLSKPLLPADAEVCLITKREGKLAKELLKTANITSINKVISFAKLKKNYKSYESKRQLAALHDVFLCEDNIYHLLPRTLGKAFFSKKKFPHPVNLKKTDLKGEIDKALNSTYISLGHGTCSAIKIGHIGQDPTHVIANIITASKEITKVVPRGWKNIKSINIKTSTSVSLPIHNSLPDRPAIVEAEDEIEETENPKKKEKKVKEEKGEREKIEAKETRIKEKKGIKEKVALTKENDEVKQNKNNKEKKVRKGNDQGVEQKKRRKGNVETEGRMEIKKTLKKRKTRD